MPEKEELEEMVHSRPSIIAFSPEEIFSVCRLEKNFQATQVFAWLASGITSFEDMTNLPITLRQILDEKFSIYTTHVVSTLKDKSSFKIAIKLKDKAVVEAVLLIDEKQRLTACLSSQVGCPLSCRFCKTGMLGFKRNLTSGEIVEEFHHLTKIAKKKIDNIVFMGMGEPLLNITEVQKAISILTHPKGLALSKRRITISTAGLINEIRQLANEGDGVRLAVSLTVADHASRLSLMPVEKANPLDELKTAIKYFNDKTHKRVTLEIALISGVNTSKEMVRKVIEFAKDLNVFINLIPWNPIKELPFSTPSSKEVDMVEKQLKNSGLTVAVRRKKGGNIAGSCGQLGRVNMKKSLLRKSEK